MKIVVDRAKCGGVGICEVTAPATFEIDDNGDPAVPAGDVAADQLGAVKDAVARCPTQALRLIAE